MPFPIAAAAIMGGASLLGGLLSNRQNQDNVASANAANLQATREANASSERSVQAQMDFQERMSNSAYQRATTDMRKAGINPMLAYSQGGASAPSGSSFTAQAPKAEAARAENVLSPAVSSAVDAGYKGQLAAEIDTNIAGKIAGIKVAEAQALATAQSAKNAAIQNTLLQQEAKKGKVEADFYDSPEGKTLYNIDKFSDSIGGVLDNVMNARRIFQRRQYGPRRGTGTLKDGTNFDLKTGEIFQP